MGARDDHVRLGRAGGAVAGQPARRRLPGVGDAERTLLVAREVTLGVDDRELHDLGAVGDGERAHLERVVDLTRGGVHLAEPAEVLRRGWGDVLDSGADLEDLGPGSGVVPMAGGAAAV